MVLHKENGFSIFFGDTQSCDVARSAPEFKDFCVQLGQKLGLNKVVLQRQVHGVEGTYLDASRIDEQKIVVFENEGDLLITDQPRVGIGVLTADCLPIVFYDRSNAVAAVAHAGWRGAVAEIALHTLKRMRERKKFKQQDLQIFFGPSAQVCCYEVTEDFLPNLAPFSYKDRVIHRMDNGKIYFDLPLFNKLQLIDFGVEPSLINLDYNRCTICNPVYHSFRRKKSADFCQITMVNVIGE